MNTHDERWMHVALRALYLCLLAAAVRPAPAATPLHEQALPPVAALTAADCAALASRMTGRWPDAGTQVESARWLEAGPFELPGNAYMPAHSLPMPAHCELVARLQEREGVLGQHYAIRFLLRLPGDWNGRFLFTGGGGSNGELGDALGQGAGMASPALQQGYAIVSQDSGHDNRSNVDPQHGGVLAFGFDPQARANYGHASLPLVADAAKAAIGAFYGMAPRHSYFVGCSKGGEEAMVVAQRYATRFDGIVAGAPGMSLPRAALAEAWDTQSFARLLPAAKGTAPDFRKLADVFSPADFALVSDAVLAACDALDGLADGLVGNFPACTTRRVLPELDRRSCRGVQTPGNCIAQAKVDALLRVMGGPRDSRGRTLYSDWNWDAGIAVPGWRMWKIGGEGGRPPALNVLLGAGSLASVFTVPPTALPPDPQALFEWQLGFDFGRDAGRIYDKAGAFTRSAWQDVSARSPDLDVLERHGARLIVWHGVSDPVFSVRDTIAWWQEAHERYHGAESRFLRVFPVPGMGHCVGGPATGEFNVLDAITGWVEEGQAPDVLPAKAGALTPWPGRERALCAWPKTSHYIGHGDPERAQGFECR